MAELTMNQVSPQTDAEYELAIERCLEEMKRTRQQMNRDQEDIGRFKAETHAILAELRTL